VNVDEARLVPWHTEEFKGKAIGGLLDDGKIVLSDLGNAIERAYDRRVREASRTLLLYALSHNQDESTSASEPLNVITFDYRSFAERRQIQFAMLYGAVMGGILGLIVAFWVYIAFFRGEPQSTDGQFSPISLIIALSILIVMIMLLVYTVNRLLDNIDKKIRLYRKGQRGEERILNTMFSALDGNWWLFRNLELPGQRNGDIDFVLVGSKGIWAIEVKTYDGEYRTVGDRWERQLGTRWLNTFKNPTWQAKKNATLLSHIFKTNSIKQWVNPAIIWANPESKLTIENPAVFVWELDNLRDVH
jgi:hypothetical protein